MKTEKLRIVLIMIAFFVFPVFLNIIFTIGELLNFGGYRNDFVKILIHGFFYLANWGSLLFNLYPYSLDLDGKVVYLGMGWQTPLIFIFNSLVWGLVGVILVLIYKAKIKQKKS